MESCAVMAMREVDAWCVGPRAFWVLQSSQALASNLSTLGIL